MSNFTPVRIGGWNFREKLTSWQMSELQARLLKCPNLTDGSSHSPSSPFRIGGSGISMTGPLRLRVRRIVVSGSTTVSSADPEILVVSPTGGYIVTLSSSGASDGEWKLFINSSIAQEFLLQATSTNGEIGGLITVAGSSMGSAVYVAADSRWYVAGGSGG
jgi:hypothetical protein